MRHDDRGERYAFDRYFTVTASKSRQGELRQDVTRDRGAYGLNVELQVDACHLYLSVQAVACGAIKLYTMDGKAVRR